MTIILLVVILYCIPEITANYVGSRSRKIDVFVANLINQRFDNCTLMILQDTSEYDESFDYVAHNTNINLFHVKFSDNNTEGNKSSPVKFPITVGNYHRRSYQCLVAVLMLSSESPELFKQIFRTITPVYIPITRKDEDHYIFITSSEIMERVLLNKELTMKIKFKIGISENSNKQLSIKSVCFFCDGGNSTIVEFPVNNTEDYFPDYVINLNGKNLIISIPYIRAKIEKDGPPDTVSNAHRGNWKFMLDQFLKVKFNFTYNIIVSTGMNGRFGGGGTGLQLSNGSWIGITGDIISGKATLGLVIANTPKRIRYIDFTHSFYDTGCLTYVTAMGRRVYSPLALLWPFDIGMWGCMGLSILFSFLFFAGLIVIMRVFHLGENESWSLKLQFQFIIASFLDQGTALPRFTPLRFFVALWLFFTMIATNVYRSKMVSLIAFPIKEVIPKTFEELAYSDYQVGFMKHGDSAYNTLAASTDPVYVKLLAEMEIINGVGLECLEKVVKHRYGCIAYDFAIRHLLERNLSDSEARKLVFAPATTYNIWLGLALEGKSIFKTNFGKWLSYTRSFFLADIWDKIDMYYNVRLLKKEWWAQTNQTDKAKSTDAVESSDLTLKHFAGAFYVLLVGLLICTYLFIWENIKYKITKLKVSNKKVMNVFLIIEKATKFLRIRRQLTTDSSPAVTQVQGNQPFINDSFRHSELFQY